MFTKIDRIAENVAAIMAKMDEKEKRCKEHTDNTDDHEKRLRVIEAWKNAQEGISGLIQRWGPVAISAGIGIFVATK